ncbi:MAG: N-methyl-D-aspartate receptor NMDAR2C subunit [Acidobacteria bacterium]|nr:MAG: N-methyl-D-aspartate receptor NMDAR2C subunit [Acidobacteriota bacterium]REK11496.1 MAG: N-methyl-D-aspartate receptor NMDAR2C subunit [Acidobacteriota bacterium]
MKHVQLRWSQSWELLGLAPPDGVLERLLERHAEDHRHYHDLDHVLDCLEKAVGSRAHQRDPAAVDLALWFHDAIYDPRRGDNEERSAELAERELAPLLPAELVSRIAGLILDTRHDSAPSSADGAVVVDIDLSILGETPQRFAAYEEAIRAEYEWVPEPLFRRERRRILQSFLERDAIYSTDSFREQYEERARANLERAIARL